MKKFKDKYGIIKDVSDHEYFTNSIHVPVWYNLSPFDKIDIESQLTGYSSAGCITYVELDTNVIKNTVTSEEVSFVGFGKFVSTEKSERVMRNPRTGEQVTVPAKKSVRFKPAKLFKDFVNS